MYIYVYACMCVSVCVYRTLLLRINHCKRNNQIYIYTCTHIHIDSINKIKRYVEGNFFCSLPVAYPMQWTRAVVHWS